MNNGNTIVEHQETTSPFAFGAPPCSVYANGFSRLCANSQPVNDYGNVPSTISDDRIINHQQMPAAVNGLTTTNGATSNGYAAPAVDNSLAYNQQWSYIFDFMNKRWLDDNATTQNGSCTNGNSAVLNRQPFYFTHSCQMPQRNDLDTTGFSSLLNNTNFSNNVNSTANCNTNGSTPSPYLPLFGLTNGHSRCSSLFDHPTQCGRPSPVFANGETRPSPSLLPPPVAQAAPVAQFSDRSSRRLSPSMLDSFLNDNRLLEEFRAGRLPNLQLRDLVNHVIDFAQDQYGSRFIQQRLQYATDIEKQMVFNEILPSAHLLTINVFGNYVIQKFFELGTSSQKMQILEQMRGKILNLTLNMYGCRVVQKALERVEREGQRMIANELTGHILRCVKDQNGNHVVQKVIETLDANQLAFVVLALAGQIVALSTHSYGCRVIQRILERCSEEEKLSILNELIENFQILVVDQYGNYVVQHILQHGNQDNRSRIIQAVRGDMIRLAQHKFASNVVEKCVEYATTEERRILIDDIIGKAQTGTVANCPLLLMMKDQYANYVVQKMLELSEPPQRKEMMYLIRYHMPTLKRYTYGKHILAKLEKFFQKNSMTIITDANKDDTFSGTQLFFN